MRLARQLSHKYCPRHRLETCNSVIDADGLRLAVFFLELKRFSKFEGLSEILKTKALLQKMQSTSQKCPFSLVNESIFLSKSRLKMYSTVLFL